MPRIQIGPPGLSTGKRKLILQAFAERGSDDYRKNEDGLYNGFHSGTRAHSSRIRVGATTIVMKHNITIGIPTAGSNKQIYNQTGNNTGKLMKIINNTVIYKNTFIANEVVLWATIYTRNGQGAPVAMNPVGSVATGANANQIYKAPQDVDLYGMYSSLCGGGNASAEQIFQTEGFVRDLRGGDSIYLQWISDSAGGQTSQLSSIIVLFLSD